MEVFDAQEMARKQQEFAQKYARSWDQSMEKNGAIEGTVRSLLAGGVNI